MGRQSPRRSRLGTARSSPATARPPDGSTGCLSVGVLGQLRSTPPRRPSPPPTTWAIAGRRGGMTIVEAEATRGIGGDMSIYLHQVHKLHSGASISELYDAMENDYLSVLGDLDVGLVGYW